MALRDRRTNNFLELWCLVSSGGAVIWVYQPVFKKIASAGLSSLRQKGYQILVKNWIFDDPLHKKKNCIGHLCVRDDPTMRSSKLFDEMRLLRSLRPLRLLRL